MMSVDSRHAAEFFARFPDPSSHRLLIADWRHATEFFARARQIDSSSPLADKAQRQLRRIGGYFVQLARFNDVESLYGLGVMYDRGWGPKPDRQEAKRFYRSAAMCGSDDAKRRLAAMHDEDVATGPGNPKAKERREGQALELHRNAAARSQSPGKTASPPVDPQARKDYQDWLEQYAEYGLDKLKLAVTSVGDEAKSANSFGTDVSRETCKVTIDGAISAPLPLASAATSRKKAPGRSLRPIGNGSTNCWQSFRMTARVCPPPGGV